MCLKCQGLTDAQIRAHYLALIEDHGWAICTVGAGPGSPPMAYTIGLTRYHGHPELVISGLAARDATPVLNDLGAEVRDGRRLSAGEVIGAGRPHPYQLIEVWRPRRLIWAHEIYGGPDRRVVPALQLVWADHDGRWPWLRPGRDRYQHLLGPAPANSGGR
ncbi:DUF4262 domain-containing protein [Occultella aeris]|uniref:DUF4262 domain-containing protein n=1 Tax=Occultella aeris TaxID=2761496 RepID=A0A7M4DMA5_9MICO|nr:DUF4262 domain-containing protein [Occultella aeris]VZO38504.1 hypothetical protein HALOF300_03274 [Occultella aeris]